MLCLYLYCVDYVSSVFQFDFTLSGYFVHSYIICSFFIEWQSLFLSIVCLFILLFLLPLLANKDEYITKFCKYCYFFLTRYVRSIRVSIYTLASPSVESCKRHCPRYGCKKLRSPYMYVNLHLSVYPSVCLLAYLRNAHVSSSMPGGRTGGEVCRLRVHLISRCLTTR